MSNIADETTSEKGEFNFLDWLIPLKTDSALPESGAELIICTHLIFPQHKAYMITTCN